MADSSAYMPGHSPGARIQDGAGTASRTSRCVVRMAGVAYMTRVQAAVCSANSVRIEVCSTTSCATAVRRPEASAASCRRWMVGVLYPVSSNICWRVSAILTGRPAARAARTARMACGRVVPFEPNPPPTCLEMTRTSALGMPRTFAIVSRSADAPWLESNTVSRPPESQAASAACGSIGLLCSTGVV